MIEMEKQLTLDELNLIVKAAREKAQEDRKFFAALKGIDLEKGEEDSAFERVKTRAAAALAGKTEQEYVFDMIGIEVESDEED